MQEGDPHHGVVFYVGGAGPVGNVGFLSVPTGLGDAGYRGRVEVFAWQGIGAAMDQVSISRNRGKAMELAQFIRRQKHAHPQAPVDVIALSAGTGIASFALGYLPEDVRVRNVVYLGCSMAARYDLTPALKRMEGRLFNFHSDSDAVLGRIVPYTGTVDRSDASEGIAGLTGFRMPAHVARDTTEQYSKVRNIPYHSRFASTGYSGGHMDSTRREFIANYVAPLLLNFNRDLGLNTSCPAPKAADSERRAQTEPPA